MGGLSRWSIFYILCWKGRRIKCSVSLKTWGPTEAVITQSLNNPREVATGMTQPLRNTLKKSFEKSTEWVRDYLFSISWNRCSMSTIASGFSRFILTTNNGSSATCLLAWSKYLNRVLKSRLFLHSIEYGNSFRAVCEVNLMSAPASDISEVLMSSLPNTGYSLIIVLRKL